MPTQQPAPAIASGSWYWTFCRQCHELKTWEQMRADRRFKTGRRPTCEECQPPADQELLWARRQVNTFRARAYGYGIAPVSELLTRSDIIARHGDRCVYCPKGRFEQIDHRVPVAAGGHHLLDNVVPCCERCNRGKSGRPDRTAIRQFREARAASRP